jgi:hypothetical protein
MKKLLLGMTLLSLVSCAKKQWSKDYLVKKCNKEMKNNKEVNGLVSDENLGKICDCVSEKMFIKYKSESEADKDKMGAEQIGKDCAMAVLAPGLPAEAP